MGKWQRILYQPGLPLGEDGRRATACEKHRMLSKEAAKEGMVLLKNDNALLPLKKGTRAALFGKASLDYVKGGGGSGDVTVSYSVNLYEGLRGQNGHVTLYEPLSAFYSQYVKAQYEDGGVPGLLEEPELTEELYRDAAEKSDVAVIAINRFSGEGWDRRSQYDSGKSNKDETTGCGCLEQSAKLFERGDFYLSVKEMQMVEQVKKYFSKIVVVLNVGGVVDTSWFAKDEAFGAVMLLWNAGMEGGSAAAELLCGIGNPCGKLADTFAADLEDYPSTKGFHESQDYVNYTEDIYVGYRYFETVPGMSEKVVYPFGYGLSYTTFEWNTEEIVCTNEEIRLCVSVRNTGNTAGKEVIQVYAEAPQGLLKKAKRSLIGFAKTGLLDAGEEQKLSITVPVMAMASYDDLGKIQKSAYVLEAGAYGIYVGNSVRSAAKLSVDYIVEQNRILEQYTEKVVPHLLPERLLSDGAYEKLPQLPPIDPNECGIERTAVELEEGLSPDVRYRKGRSFFWHPYSEDHIQLADVAAGKHTLEELVQSMQDKELIELVGGQPNTTVANTYGIGNMPEYGIPNAMTADGPAGLRIEPQCGVHTTAWPCATLLACTWNEELLYKVGEASSLEVKENNIAVWLAPAVNIHRSPLCGRNFEYYSEDPLVTGKLAASMVRGIQSQNIAATVKHFACNNKETNRMHSDSRVSERALREIYLKAFEIIVKEADPWCVMTSYNIINGRRSSENQELIQGILRGEWGFDGMVMTDWWCQGLHYKEVKAGNDVKMPRGYAEHLETALKQHEITRGELENCAKHILQLFLKLD